MSLCLLQETESLKTWLKFASESSFSSDHWSSSPYSLYSIPQVSQKVSHKSGPLLYLRVFNLPIVLVSSASVAYEIFKTHDLSVSCHGLPPFKESLLFGSSGFISAPYGDYWRFMKKLTVTKLLGPKALEQSRSTRADELQRFYMNLLDKAMKKENVEIGKEAMKLTNNSICKMIMGRRCSEENGEAERVRGLVTTTFALTKKIFLASILHAPLEKLGISLFKKGDNGCFMNHIVCLGISGRPEKTNLV
ncbi:unnamed protein product [Arabis nemorensis]|uniref:Cytochrome P450 n=1 Tax=Arabis nemorensis TaxID=586526 RepID=A0A565CQK5_9BRAS|nr:unnamed protein product [Arabis nemorensis]